MVRDFKVNDMIEYKNSNQKSNFQELGYFKIVEMKDDDLILIDPKTLTKSTINKNEATHLKTSELILEKIGFKNKKDNLFFLNDIEIHKDLVSQDSSPNPVFYKFAIIKTSTPKVSEILNLVFVYQIKEYLNSIGLQIDFEECLLQNNI
jgi:hypothetical protein